MAWKAPLEWYWKNIATINCSSEETGKGITWIEMTLDFEIATRVMLTGSRTTRKGKELTTNNEGKGPDTVRQRAFNFARASRSLVGGIGKGELKVANTIPTLTPFGGRPMTGLTKRMAILQPLAVFKEIGTQAVTYKSLLEAGKPTCHHWKWAPRYVGLPKKLWSSPPTILKEANKESFRREQIGRPKWRIGRKVAVARVSWLRNRKIGQDRSPLKVARRIRGKTEEYKIQFKYLLDPREKEKQPLEGSPLRSPGKRRLRIRGKTRPSEIASEPQIKENPVASEFVAPPGMGRSGPLSVRVSDALHDQFPLVQGAIGRRTHEV